MKDNLHKVAERGEKLDDLQEKAGMYNFTSRALIANMQCICM